MYIAVMHCVLLTVCISVDIRHHCSNRQARCYRWLIRCLSESIREVSSLCSLWYKPTATNPALWSTCAHLMRKCQMNSNFTWPPHHSQLTSLTLLDSPAAPMCAEHYVVNGHLSARVRWAGLCYVFLCISLVYCMLFSVSFAYMDSIFKYLIKS